MVDGCRSKLVNVVSGVPQGSVLGPQLFFLSRICWRKLRAAQYSADNLLTNTGKVFTFRSVNYSTAGCRNNDVKDIKTVVFDENSQVKISKLNNKK